jgi:hypothetical protein
MNYREGIAAMAVAGSLFSCAPAASSPAVSGATEKRSCPVGALYRDLFMYEPPTADKLKATDDVSRLVSGLQKRIVFIAGQETLDEADAICTGTIEKGYCALLENAGTFALAENFNQAVRHCYNGPVLEDGSPDSRGSGQMDIDCFLKESLSPVDSGNTESAREKCRSMVYDCWRTIYIAFRDRISGRK